MYRVLRPGGLVASGAHGPEHYWEPVDATVRALNKKHLLGYRFEFWPRTEKQIHKLVEKTGFKNVRTNRLIWRNLFSDPAKACDFSQLLLRAGGMIKFLKPADYVNMRKPGNISLKMESV
jgi:hypothetical protein